MFCYDSITENSCRLIVEGEVKLTHDSSSVILRELRNILFSMSVDLNDGYIDG